MKIKLGSKVKDRVTGFVGTVTGHCQYLTGCDTYLLVPETNDKTKYPEGHWLDVNRCEVISDEIIKLDTTDDKGACEEPPMY